MSAIPYFKLDLASKQLAGWLMMTGRHDTQQRDLWLLEVQSQAATQGYCTGASKTCGYDKAPVVIMAGDIALTCRVRE